jgi:hypothetical protein
VDPRPLALWLRVRFGGSWLTHGAAVRDLANLAEDAGVNWW